MNKINCISEEQLYLTVLSDDFSLGDILVLEKDLVNKYDTEAILVSAVFSSERSLRAGRQPHPLDDRIYIANSVRTRVIGTHSAGRIYDKFKGELVAKVIFQFRDRSIVEVLGEVLSELPGANE